MSPVEEHKMIITISIGYLLRNKFRRDVDDVKLGRP